MKSNTKTLTEGPLAKQIFLVSLPLALSNLLQVLFCNAPPGAFPTSILSEKKLQLLRNCSHFYFTTITYFSAIASISQRTPFGRDLTATQLLAGLEVKYLAYTSLNAVKSPISAKKQVVLITLS